MAVGRGTFSKMARLMAGPVGQQDRVSAQLNIRGAMGDRGGINMRARVAARQDMPGMVGMAQGFYPQHRPRRARVVAVVAAVGVA